MPPHSPLERVALDLVGQMRVGVQADFVTLISLVAQPRSELPVLIARRCAMPSGHGQQRAFPHVQIPQHGKKALTLRPRSRVKVVEGDDQFALRRHAIFPLHRSRA
jgi:hypothetical protein